MGLHKNIVLKDSPIYGSKHQGLYAIGPIKKGEIIWHAEPFEENFWYDLDTINSWDEEKRNKFMSRAYIVKEGVYSGIIDDSWDDSECMNHSCDPNTWWDTDDYMVASRDIEEGEEITYDYATSEVEGSYHLPMKCLCGSSICRGTIKPTDYLEPWFKERYGTKKLH